MPHYIDFTEFRDRLAHELDCDPSDISFYWDLYDQDSLADFGDSSIFVYGVSLEMVFLRKRSSVTHSGFDEVCIFDNIFAETNRILQDAVGRFTGRGFSPNLSSFFFASTTQWSHLSETRMLSRDRIAIELRRGDDIDGLICIHNLLPISVDFKPVAALFDKS